MKALMLCVLCGLPWVASAFADSRIIESTDPAGEEIRAAARAFMARLAEADAKGAESLFAGPEDQRKLMEAYLAGAKASQRWKKAMRERFGHHQDIEQAGVDSDLRRIIRSTRGKPIILDGELASLSPGGHLDNGFDLKQIAGQWKVVSLSSLKDEAEPTRDLLNKTAEAVNAVSQELEQDRHSTYEAAMASLAKRMGSIRKQRTTAPSSH